MTQIIDYWLLFFLITTSLNIAVHIIIDHFHRKEKTAVEKAVEKWKDHVRIDFQYFKEVLFYVDIMFKVKRTELYHSFFLTRRTQMISNQTMKMGLREK